MHYMELSFEGDPDGIRIPSAIRLCRNTGSHASADELLAELRFRNPRLARLYERGE